MKLLKNSLILFGFFFILSLPLLTFAIEYQTLAPITTQSADFVSETVALNEEGLTKYLNDMYRFGIALCGALAVLMILFGAIQRMSSDSWSKQEEGLKKINAAVLGLLVVLGSYALLKTVNPALLSTELGIQQVNVEGIFTNLSNPPQPTGRGPVAPGGGNNGGGGLTGPDGVPGLREDGESSASAILRNAQYAADTDQPLNTCSVPGTNGGRAACAYAVNQIVESALGKPITNSLSTIEMNRELQNSPYFTNVGSDLRMAQPGDIIMSPTQGSNTGHVGICETLGCGTIISNSSRNAEVQRNFTADSWNNYYKNTKNLQVIIYRPN